MLAASIQSLLSSRASQTQVKSKLGANTHIWPPRCPEISCPGPLPVICSKSRTDTAVKVHAVTGGEKDQTAPWKRGSYNQAPSTRIIHSHKSLVAHFCKILMKDDTNRLHELFWWFPSAFRRFYLQMQWIAWIYHMEMCTCMLCMKYMINLA